MRQITLPGPVRTVSAGFATCCILDACGPPAPALVPDDVYWNDEYDFFYVNSEADTDLDSGEEGSDGEEAEVEG